MNYEHLRRVLDAQHELICEWTPDGVIHFSNSAYRRYFGYGRDMVGENLREIIDWPPGDGPPITLAAFDSGSESVVTVRSYDDGRSVEWTDAPDRDEAGAIRSVVSVGRDITAQVKAEQALAAAQARHRTMTAYTLDSVVLVSADGTVVDSTSRHREDLGYPAGAWSERMAIDKLHPDDRVAVAAAFNELVQRGPDAEAYLEVRAQRFDGTCSTIEAHGVNLLHDPEVGAIVLTLRVIDRRKAIELELEQRRDEAEAALRRRIAFVEKVSHELRNPLHGMLGLGEVLAAAHLPDELADAAWGVVRQSNTMRRIVDDLLDVAQMEVGHLRVRPERFDLAFAFKDCEFLARKSAVDGVSLVAVEPPDEVRHVFADPDRVRQAITNLLSNACKYTRAGEIRLSASRGAFPGTVRVSVEDSGVGIAGDDVDRLFEPYERGGDPHVPGVGLGLAIVKGTVEAMGGAVGGAPRRVGGSVFWFELPLAQGVTDSRPTVRPLLGLEGSPDQPLTALVVDDDPVNLMLAGMQLTRLGHVVDTADSGEVALAKLMSGGYDVALVDVQLPGISGLDLVRTVRTVERPMPFIAVMTASATASDRQAALSAGADMFVPKPATAVDVHLVLSRAADRAAERRSHDANG